jgi:hypothetical protein
MILTVTATEEIKPHVFVSLLFNDDSRVLCRNSLPTEPPDAISARYIGKGDSLIFDSGKDTIDLLRPLKEHYEGKRKRLD